jgi:hypothetical protein
LRLLTFSAPVNLHRQATLLDLSVQRPEQLVVLVTHAADAWTNMLLVGAADFT